MPFAVEFFFDQKSTDRVRDVWSNMSNLGYGVEMTGRPHVTLAIWDAIDIEEAHGWLRAFALELQPFSIRFASVGLFARPRSVIFLTPVVTAYLLEIQEKFRTSFRGPVGDSWSNFRPGWWVPHCTLAHDIGLASLPAALATASEIELPFEAEANSIGIVEFPSITEHGTFRLGVRT